MDFSQLPIPEPVMAGVRECGFVTCTPIQALTLPLSLAGRDVAGQAQTGTGKTAAFLIAVFTRLLLHPPARDHGDQHARSDEGGAPRCLIISPTRELAVQIERDARALGAHCNFGVAAVYGGIDYEKQRTTLLAGKVDILIATPGRLTDYLKQKAVTLRHVEALVIDEADRLFDMGFAADVRWLLRRLPPFEKRLSLLFSATLSYRAQELSWEFMNNPEVVAAATDTRTVEKVRQVLHPVEGTRKISLLIGLLRRDLAESESGPGGRVMIFINTKRMGERLEGWLNANGIACGYLSGDVPQAKRLKVLQQFQEGVMPVVIATDVAGRGLHIEGVTHVINFDLPENAEDYVHRIGRTARAGEHGDAISLVDEEGAYLIEAIQTYINMKLPFSMPEDALFIRHLNRPERRPDDDPDRLPLHMRHRSSSGGGRGRSGPGGGGGRGAGRSESGSATVSRYMRGVSASTVATVAKPESVAPSAVEAPPVRQTPQPTPAAPTDAAAPGETPAAPRKRRPPRKRKPASPAQVATLELLDASADGSIPPQETAAPTSGAAVEGEGAAAAPRRRRRRPAAKASSSGEGSSGAE
ncbi:MAG: DEAD/DEAH box helicase [Magnetococcales bacterium]|nr:DEAD/DEAH box helicase [Magnetococcales bacterium]